MNDKFITVSISIIASVITTLVVVGIKWFRDTRLHVFKLNTEHLYEQRKKVKTILAHNKMQLLSCAESLNNRLWHFYGIHSEGRHDVKGHYFNPSNEYFNSFVYRFIVVFSWVRKIEQEMDYVDATVAAKDDLQFIKYLRILPQVMTNVTLLNNVEYKTSASNDHFYRYTLEKMSDKMICGEKVIQYMDFEQDLKENMAPLNELCIFLDGISPDEGRSRWDRLQTLHLVIICFLNDFGYDFQRTKKEKIQKLIQEIREPKVVQSVVKLIEDYSGMPNSSAFTQLKRIT